VKMIMNPIFKKLQFKESNKILVINSPKEFQQNLAEMTTFTEIDKNIEENQNYNFALVFVKSCAEIAEQVKIADNLNDDALFWFAYPKKSSKKYQSDISRDAGWQPLGDLGFEGVRQIAIDDDWSALRFRHTKYIKSFKRDKKRAMSKEGRARKDYSKNRKTK